MGNRTLVLLPGMDGTGKLYRPLVDVLPSSINHRVISYPSDEVVSAEKIADGLSSELGELGEVILFAESYGGQVAMHLLEKAEAHIKGVIFCASFLRPPAPLLLKLSEWLPLDRIMPVLMNSFTLNLTTLGFGGLSLSEMVSQSLEEVSPSVLAERIKEIRLASPTGWKADDFSIPVIPTA